MHACIGTRSGEFAGGSRRGKALKQEKSGHQIEEIVALLNKNLSDLLGCCISTFLEFFYSSLPLSGYKRRPRRVRTQGCMMIDYPPLDLSIKKRYSVYSSNQVNNRTLSSRIPPQWPHKEKAINYNINCNNDINIVAFYVIDLFGIAIL